MDGVNSYSCNCVAGFIGDHCETGKTRKTHFNDDNSFRIVQARVSFWIGIFLSPIFFLKNFNLRRITAKVR